MVNDTTINGVWNIYKIQNVPDPYLKKLKKRGEFRWQENPNISRRFGKKTKKLLEIYGENDVCMKMSNVKDTQTIEEFLV